MPFQKGQSGNSNGRPRQTAEQREQKAQFQALLRNATIPALQSIIEIAENGASKERLAACKYIIEKAYGADATLVVEDEQMTIRIVSGKQDNEAAWEEDEWE